MFRFLLASVSLFFTASVFAGATPWAPFELDRGALIIDGSIVDEPVRVQLDSGAQSNMISAGFVRKHGERLHFKTGTEEFLMTGIAMTRSVNPIKDTPLEIFGAVFNMELLVPARVRDVDVLLGVDFFSHSIVQIDYPNQRLRLIERDSLDLKKIKNVKLKRMRARGQGKIRVTLNGEEERWIILDTGASGGLLLNESIAQKRGWLERYETTVSGVIGVNGLPVRTRTFTLPTLTIGPYTVEEVPVTVMPDDLSTFQYGLLGYEVLKHFQLTMDLKKKRLHIEAVERIEP